MSLIRINCNPSIKDLRLFAFLWLLFLGGFSFVANGRGHATVALVLLALAVGGLGLLVPRTVRLEYVFSVYATFPIGFVLSHVVLAMVYYVVLTPIGLVMRMLGRDPLHRRFDVSSG